MFGKKKRRVMKIGIINSRISEFVMKFVVVAEWDGSSAGGTGLAG
jgi:hypothetical protein